MRDYKENTMYGMLKNLEVVKTRRYHNFLLSQRQTNVNAINSPIPIVKTQPRGRPMMVTGRRTLSMGGITGYKSSGGGCGCGS